MAYTKDNLRLKQTIGDFFSEFVYKTEDNLSVVAAANYFDKAVAEYGLRDGDVICVLAKDKSAFVKAKVAAGTNAVTTTFFVISAA